MMRRLAIFFVFLVACGGREAAPPAAPEDAPASYAAPAPQPQGFAPPAPPPPDSGTVHSGGTPSTPEEAQAIIEAETQRLDEAFAADELSGSCDRVCRALGSMRRAVEGLCEMTGDDDDRCESARGRLADNEARVSGAGCGC